MLSLFTTHTQHRDAKGEAEKRTSQLELAHVCIHEGQPSLAVLPSLKGSGVVVPPHLLACDAVLSKQLVAMLLSEEPAGAQHKNAALDS